MADLVLASESPRRKTLLSGAGLDFDVEPSGFEEPPPSTGQLPSDYALRLAIAKAGAVAGLRPHALVIGADTVIEFEGRVLGKPRNMAHARSMLTALAGQWHTVITAICVATDGGVFLHSASVSTPVAMAVATRRQIASYVATGEPLDKAGGYAIQGRGGRLVERIEGCYNNVVGLPLCELDRLLRTAGGPPMISPCQLPDGLTCPRLTVTSPA